MKLSEIKDQNEYKIKNFGNLSKKEIETFYEQGLVEGETITVNQKINKNKNTILIIIDTTTYAFDIKYAKEIEVGI